MLDRASFQIQNTIFPHIHHHFQNTTFNRLIAVQCHLELITNIIANIAEMQYLSFNCAHIHYLVCINIQHALIKHNLLKDSNILNTVIIFRNMGSKSVKKKYGFGVKKKKKNWIYEITFKLNHINTSGEKPINLTEC